MQKKIASDTKNFVTRVMDLQSSGQLAGKNISDLTNSFTNVNSSVIKAAQSLKSGKIKVDEFKQSALAASSSTVQFASALKSAAVNIGIMLLASLAFKAVTAIWDKVNVTVEETKAQLDELASSLQNMQSEYEALSSKDPNALSQSEKERLKYLEDRIALEKELLDIQQHAVYSEELSNDFTAFADKDSQVSKLGAAANYQPAYEGMEIPESDSWIGKALGYFNKANMAQNRTSAILTEADRIEELIDAYGRAAETAEKYKDAANGTSSSSKAIDAELEHQRLRGELANKQEQTFVNLASYQEEYDRLQSEIDSGLLTEYETALAQGYQKQWQEKIEAAREYYNTIDNILHQTDALKNVDERAGKVTADELKAAFRSSELEVLAEMPFDEDATLGDLKSLLEKAQAQADSAPITPSLLFEDEASNALVDSFQARVSSLSHALSKLSAGGLSSNELTDLLQQFPELEGKTDHLDAAIKSLIDGSLEDLLKSLGPDLPEESVKLFTSIAEEAKNASNSVKTIPEAWDALKSSSQAMEDLKSSIAETGSISTELVMSLMEKYPQMTDILSDYLQGLASQEDVLGALQGIYETDLANYRWLCLGKKIYDADFYQSVLAKLPAWVVSLAKSYGIDLQNFKSLAEAKAKIEEILIRGSETAWNRHLDHLDKAKAISLTTEGERETLLAEQQRQRALDYQKAANDISGGIGKTIDDIYNVSLPALSPTSSPDYPSSTPKAAKAKQAFDWTANSIDNLQNKLDKLNLQLQNTSSWEKQLSIQKKIIEAQAQLTKGYVSQASAYKKHYEAASKKLTASQKEMVESGSVFQISTYGEELYKKLTDAQSAYQNWKEAQKNVSSSLSDIADTAQAIYNIPLEKCSEKVQQFTKRIESLEKELDTINDSKDIKGVFNRQRKSYTSIYQEHLAAEIKAKKSLSQAGEDLSSSMSRETKAAKSYVKGQISKNKAIETEQLKTTAAKIAAEKYNSALAASKTASKNAKAALEDYAASLRELSKSEIDRIAQYYENRSSINSAKGGRVQSQMELTKAKGYAASASNYKQLMALAKTEQRRLEEEKAKLAAQMEEGSLSEDDYYDALQRLYSISDKIDSCKKSQIEWSHAIQSLQWDKFDDLMGKLEGIQKESDFLISLYREEDLLDENGSLTKDGMAVQALHGQNYSLYLAQAEKYGQELKKINGLLAADPNSQRLQDRRQELLEAQQQAISNAGEEKESILSLVEEAYHAQADALSELADKKQELLDQEKALHDYQKSIRSQSGAVEMLEKQIKALSLSTDRADIAKRLKLEEELANAREGLEETQYEHSIETQKEALSQALEDYKKQTDAYLEDRASVFEDALSEINSHGSSVLESLQEKAQEAGYALSDSILAIWSNTAPISNYADTAIQSFTGIGEAIGQVASKLEELYAYYEKIASSDISNLKSDYESYPDRETAMRPTAGHDVKTGSDKLLFTERGEKPLIKRKPLTASYFPLPQGEGLQSAMPSYAARLPGALQPRNGSVNVNAPLVVVEGNLDNVTQSQLKKAIEKVPDTLLNQMNRFGSRSSRF